MLDALRNHDISGIVELSPLDCRPIIGPRWYMPKMLVDAAFGTVCIAIMMICALWGLP